MASKKAKAPAAADDGIVCIKGFDSELRCRGMLCHRADDGSIAHIRAAVSGRDGVKADTWYTLGADGEFVEVQP